MSATDSNLSNAEYKYDLVSALTQDALNMTLKSYLNKVIAKVVPPFILYYKYSDSFHSQTVLMTSEEVQKMTGGQNIFAIPNMAQNDLPEYAEYKELGDAMAEASFAYAFEVCFGLPAGIPSAELPDIISLYYDASRSSGKDLDQTVQYNMYFASFTIIEMKYAYSGQGWQIIKISQPDDDPWIFQWLVDLNLQLSSGVSFDSLPDQVQKNLNTVYNLDPATMFSMQQLLLDLNTTELISGADPSVISIQPPDSPLYTSLNLFIKNCWQPFVDNGGLVLNNALQPEDQHYPPSSIVPTDLNFVVSPYSDQSQKGLYTLNYLVMSNQNLMPASIQPFAWDWIDNPSDSGVMSVRRDIFLDYLNDALSPCLNQICLTVDVDMEDAFLGNPEVTVDLKANNTKHNYSKNSSNPCLRFYYKSADDDNDIHLEPLPQLTKFEVVLEVQSNVYLSENSIRCETLVTTYYIVEQDLVISNVQRYELAKKNTTTFTLGAVGTGNTAEDTSAGLLQVSSKTTIENFLQTTDSGEDYYGGDNSYLSKVMSDGKIKDYEQEVAEIAEKLDDLMSSYSSQISKIIDGTLGFVFPGAQTYFYDQPKFSANNDLTVPITFQDI